MNTKVLYSFSIYFRNPMNRWHMHGTSSAALQWDTILTVFGLNLEDAMKKLPLDYEGWSIVKVDYPIGYPSFPMFPPSTCIVGHQHNLKKA